MERYNFIKYAPPPTHNPDCCHCPDDLADEIVEWKERMRYLFEDLDWILRLSSSEFWSHIVSSQSFSGCFDSFLQFSPRPHDIQSIPPECKDINMKINKLMLLVVLRICDDSKLDGVNEQSYASILYDNFLLDIPKMMDICSIYSCVPIPTKELISKALENVFKIQPGYLHDLDVALATIFKTFDNIEERFGLRPTENEETPRQLREGNETAGIKASDLRDGLVFLYDTANSLLALLSFCKCTSKTFFERASINRFASLIDKLLPRLRDMFKDDLTQECRIYFKRTRKCFLRICHMVLHASFHIEAGDSRPSMPSDRQLCEEYLNTISTLLAETRFIMDYERNYKLSEQLNSIDTANAPELEDSVRYIRQIIGSLVPEPVLHNGVKPELTAEGASAPLSPDSIQSVVDQVKIMLPEEEDSFLRAFVVHFDGDPQAVINNILENNIPPFLQELRRSDETPAVGMGKQLTPSGHLPGNYYQKSKRISKLEQEEIFKSDRDHTMKYVEGYGQMDTYGDELIGLYDEYDDEYDDTYDSHNVGAMDADSRDELKDATTRRRAFVTPKVLQALDKQNESSEEESSSEEETEQAQVETPPDEMMYRPSDIQPGRGTRGRGRGGADGGRGRATGGRGRAAGGRGGRGRRQEPSRGGSVENKSGRGGGTRRGGQGAKQHNQKSLAMKKKGRGMGGI